MSRQRVLVAAATVLGVVGVANQTSAALFLYDPFDYPAGQDLDTQTAPNAQTWDNRGPSATTDRPVTQGTNLVYAPLGVGSGGSATFGGAGNTAAVEGPSSPIVSTPGGTVFYSLVFQVTDMTGLATTGATLAALNNASGDNNTSTGTILGARLAVKSDGAGGYKIGTERNSGTGANFAFDETQVFDTSDVVFAVLSYTFVTGGSTGTGNDEIRLWINPDSASDEATPNVTITSANGTDLAQIQSVMLRQGTTLAGIAVDELRIADSWLEAAPVPEPASLAVIGIGAIGLSSRRRRRRI